MGTGKGVWGGMAGGDRESSWPGWVGLRGRYWGDLGGSVGLAVL